MNSLRMILNIVLAVVMFGSGTYLLSQDSFFLGDRWDPGTGTLFQGMTLYCLAFGLFFLGAFAGMIGYAWAKGTLPMPSESTIRPHPAYKGSVIARFWYLVLPAVVLIILAFFLAEKAPNQALPPSFGQWRKDCSLSGGCRNAAFITSASSTVVSLSN